MASALLQKLNLETLTPSRLWTQLDPDIRADAARALYTLDESREAIELVSADAAIAQAIHFRVKMARKLPVEKKVAALATRVRPDQPLATSLLQALHLKLRRPLLTTFLDHLGIKHEDGNIADDEDPSKQSADDLKAAVAKLYETYPEAEVDVYLASLHAFEPGAWPGLAEALTDRASG